MRESPTPLRTILPHMIGAACLAILASATTLSAQARDVARAARIAVFDSRMVFDSMPGRAKAESDFALEQAKARTMLTAATDSLRRSVEEFSRHEGRMTPRQREATTMHLKARELLVEEMVANLDDIILRRNEELQAPLRQLLRATLREFRTKGGYDLLIDLSQDQLFVDADPRLDVTAQIIRAVRAAATPSRP